ncbi:HpcH/HpaI aldolase family protein [Aliidongia dinghuensis]|nr:aldolase/citrate lyase family protein [Aliidongia dinghuensis]
MWRPNGVKARLKAGEAVYGLFHGFASPLVAELLGLVGYDFVLIDGEHGPGDVMTHLAQVQAVQATPAMAMLRVAVNEPTQFKRALDIGVEGVMVPNVTSALEAAAAVESCRYPNGGKRGFAAPILRAANFGLVTAEYIARAADELLIAVQIETLAGASRAAEIAAVDGVDVVFIGPNDLSGDLGVLGQFDHPDYVKAVAAIEAGVKSAGKVLGCLPYPGADPVELHRRGHRFICSGADVALLRDAALAQLRSLPR